MPSKFFIIEDQYWIGVCILFLIIAKGQNLFTNQIKTRYLLEIDVSLRKEILVVRKFGRFGGFGKNQFKFRQIYSNATTH